MSMFYRFLFVLLCLGIVPTAFAQSGTLSASPPVVVIPAGSSLGNTDMTWSATGAHAFHVTVDCGGGDQLMASTGAGTHTVTVPWIQVGLSCTFRLRSWTATGTVLSTVTVIGVTTNGAISAAPQTVEIPEGQSLGNTTVAWVGEYADSFHVTVNCNGSEEQLMASTGAGAHNVFVPWIGVGSNCVFNLRPQTPTGPILDSVTVTGIAGTGPAPSGSISATPSTVSIPVGQSTGSTSLSWNSTGVSQVYVMSSCAGGAQSTFATSGIGSVTRTANFIPVGASCVFQLRANATNGPLLGSVTVTGQQVQGVPPITTNRGGSNHNFYRNSIADPAGGYNHGIMLHYHEAGVRETVQSQLQQMYAGGQRSLRVMVFFAHSPGEIVTSTPAETSRKCRSTGTKSCPPGDEYFIPLQYQNNIATYLADIRAAGFERVMVALGPQWINDFMSCNKPVIPASLRDQLYAGSPLVNELFEEAWGVAKEVRSIVVNAGIPYLIDLGNEYIPPSNLIEFGQCAKDIVEGTANSPGYLRFLWGRYVAAYGNQDTVGFSVIVGNSWDADNRLARMPQFLSPLPSVYSLHTYTSSGDITGGLNRAYQVTGNFGRRPWIIGETDSRSPAAANAIRSFIVNRPQQQVLHVMQWPGFNCTTEAECLPLDFSAFSSRGF